MSIALIHATTTIEVSNYSQLRDAWRSYGGTRLVGKYIVRQPITDTQRRRLHRDLRAILTVKITSATTQHEASRTATQGRRAA